MSEMSIRIEAAIQIAIAAGKTGHEVAQVVLTAMREPTEAMLFMAKEATKDWSEFGVEWLEGPGEQWKAGWQAMIDEALK